MKYLKHFNEGNIKSLSLPIDILSIWLELSTKYDINFAKQQLIDILNELMGMDVSFSCGRAYDEDLSRSHACGNYHTGVVKDIKTHFLNVNLELFQKKLDTNYYCTPSGAPDVREIEKVEKLMKSAPNGVKVNILIKIDGKRYHRVESEILLHQEPDKSSMLFKYLVAKRFGL